MHSIPASFKTLQKIFLIVGTIGLFISCAMTFKFGYSMSALHAIALCTVTVMAAFIFPAKRFITDAGYANAGRWLMVAGIFFIGLEFFSDLGYTIGMRDKSVQEASVDTVAYRNAQDSLAGDKANVEMWRKRLAELTDRNNWAATVTADGLRSQIAVLDKDIELEAARGGCKSKCRAIMAKKAAVEEKIATAEEVQNLNKQIEATQRLIAKGTDTAANTKMGFSPVKAQTDFVAQLWNISTGVEAKAALNPDAVQLTVTQILIGFFIAMGATFLPTTAFYLAFFGKKIDREALETSEDIWDRQAKRNAEKAKPLAVVSDLPGSAPKGILDSHFHITDDRGIEALKRKLASHAEQSLAILNGAAA